MEKREILNSIEWYNIFNICNDPMFLLDGNYDIIECNHKAVEVYGYTKEEFLLMNLNKLYSSSSRTELENSFNAGKEDESCVFETVHFKKDGTEFFAELSTTPYFTGDNMLFVHSVRDISARKLAEDELRASEVQYRNLINFAPHAIFIQCDNRILYVNPAGLKLFGAESIEQIKGRLVFDFIHPDYHKIAAYRINLLREGMGIPVIEEKIIRLDGSIIDAEVTAKPVRFGEQPAIEVFMHDITIRKRAELQSAYLASIVESSRNSIIACSTDGIVTYWNSGAEILYGYRNTEMLQKRLTDIVTGEYHHNLISLIERVKHGENIENYGIRFFKRDGEQISVFITLTPIRNNEANVAGVTVLSFKSL